MSTPMSKYTIAFTSDGDAAALYDPEGTLVTSGEGSEVMEHLLSILERMGVIAQLDQQQIMPEGKWKWRDTYPTLTEQQQANGA